MTKLAIRLFGYENAQTILNRTIDNKHWYMASDICRLVGIKGYSAAVNRNNKKGAVYNLTASESRYENVYTGTSKRRVLLVNDTGMLKLVMKGNPGINADTQKIAFELLSALK